jgi:hypothetical protein
MLHAHSRVCVPPECGFALWLHHLYKNEDPSSPEVKRKYALDVAATRKFETWGIDTVSLQECLRAANFRSYGELAAGVHSCYARLKQGKPSAMIGDKNNFYIERVEELHTAFPNSRFVLIVRDGRDVLCSYRELSQERRLSKYAPRLPRAAERVARDWARNNAKAVSLIEDKGLVVRYEDLVTEPKRVLTKIGDFLSVGYESSMLDFYRRNDEPLEFMAWKARTKERVDPGRVGRYREELSAEDQSIFAAEAGRVLAMFGYS